MRLHHQSLALSGPLLESMQVIFGTMNSNGPQLRVLLYHDIPDHEVELFRIQLEVISRRWRFLTPNEFSMHMRGVKSIDRDSVLLTFDDGFYSNRIVADSVLAPLGIKAVFFLVPNLLSALERDSAREYISKYIYPNCKIADLPINWSNMGWDDAKWLIGQGHEIGCHTLSHARLSQIQSRDLLELEICAGADMLAQRLGVRIAHFAYTFGDIDSISSDALEIASKRFQFVYSGIRGCNYPGTSRLAIRRESVFSSDSVALIKAYLAGAGDFPYSSARKSLDRIARNAESCASCVGYKS